MRWAFQESAGLPLVVEMGLFRKTTLLFKALLIIPAGVLAHCYAACWVSELVKGLSSDNQWAYRGTMGISEQNLASGHSRAVAFDLGDTLSTSVGIPLSWEAHYEPALERAFREIGKPLMPSQMESAKDILSPFITRKHPREEEIQSGVIFGKIFGELGITQDQLVLSLSELK